jgi:hypothetical protein
MVVLCAGLLVAIQGFQIESMTLSNTWSKSEAAHEKTPPHFSMRVAYEQSWCSSCEGQRDGFFVKARRFES